MEFTSRRSTVHSVAGMAASTQPLASAAAVRLLELGCNAAEAAVGCSAALAVVEPGMTSLGDAFCLFYDAKSRDVHGLNGSGRSSRNTDLAKIKAQLKADTGTDPYVLPLQSPYAVTVPGTAQAWVDTLERFGSGHFTLAQILEPAITLARDGFPVSQVSSRVWEAAASKMQGSGLLVDGRRAPREGELFVNEDLACVLERIAEDGRRGFYEGPTADAIVKAVQERGGVLDHEDLRSHESLFLEPIRADVSWAERSTNSGASSSANSSKDTTSTGASSEEGGVSLWELPPNNHGIVAILALNIVEQIFGLRPELAKAAHNSAAYIHVITESLKFAFKDAEHWVADPGESPLPEHLLSTEYAKERAKLFDPVKANDAYEHGDVIPLQAKSDTAYYTVVDRWGNACSMISSLYFGFGTGIVPDGLGFALHNRGCNFVLDPASRNALGPSKRTYHTIIPAMLTRASTEAPEHDEEEIKTHKGTTSNGVAEDLVASLGVMGGFMQPQGHVQVVLNLLRFGLGAQQCIDAPRICLTPHNELRGGIPVPDPSAPGSASVVLNLEDGISADVGAELERMGHTVKFVRGGERALFGRGQLIAKEVQHGKQTLHGGSDPRGDGAAMPQI